MRRILITFQITNSHEIFRNSLNGYRGEKMTIKTEKKPVKGLLFLLVACPASRKLLTGESTVRVSAKAEGSRCLKLVLYSTALPWVMTW
jgi:hypothetical protein